jgi:aminoglycoside phosphotransferase (APT) family kinase protein
MNPFGEARRWRPSSVSFACRPAAQHLDMSEDPTVHAELTKIAEGREAEIYAWEPGTVLRLFRNAPAAASIEHERVAMEAVRAIVPLVPAVLGVTEVLGRPGIIMERVDGPDLLSVIAKKPWAMWRAGRIAGEVHAQLHLVVAPLSIPSLRERGRNLPDSPVVPANIAAWAQGEFDAMPDGDRLLHGDFHPGNVLMSAHGPVVIDWPNVTRGNPDADLGRSLLLLRLGEVPPGSPLVIRLGARVARSVIRASYLRAYRRLHEVDLAVVRRWETLRAVDRLHENIPGERDKLLAVIASAVTAP